MISLELDVEMEQTNATIDRLEHLSYSTSYVQVTNICCLRLDLPTGRATAKCPCSIIHTETLSLVQSYSKFTKPRAYLSATSLLTKLRRPIVDLFRLPWKAPPWKSLLLNLGLYLKNMLFIPRDSSMY